VLVTGDSAAAVFAGQNVESLHLSGEEIIAIGDTPGQLKAMLDNKEVIP
jgi:hypothetical protein